MKTTIAEAMAKAESKALQAAEAKTPVNVHLRSQMKELMRELDTLKEQVGSRKEFAAECSATVAAADPFPRWKAPAFSIRKSLPVAVPMIKLSDWHIGEKVRADETEGLNEYDYRIAEDRIFTIMDKVLKWIEAQRRSYRIERIVIAGLGDYVSGDIHHELVATNEFPLPVQTAKAGLLLGEVVRRTTGLFDHVDLKLVGADNHGRLQKKPQAKQKTTNNMSYLVHTIAMTYLQNFRNVTAEVATGAQLVTEVGGFKFLLEHGDSIRGWGGLPFYGFDRKLGREAKRRMTNGNGFHYWCIGHFHTPINMDGKPMVNGSLSGTSEFDHICARYSEPCQVAFLVGKHGIFNWTPFHGSDK